MSDSAFPDHLEGSFGPVSAVDLALYAAASGDHNPLHLDADVAHEAGFERPVVHGMLSMAYAARLFTDAFGSLALVSLRTRFVGAALRGDSLLVRADLDRQDEGMAYYSLRAERVAGVECLTGEAVVRVHRTPRIGKARP